MIYYNFKEITSTNDYARELLDENEIVCVTAQYQTKGRGRNNNVWYGNFGNNLYISFGLSHKNPCSIEKLSNLQAIGALAVNQTLLELTAKEMFFLKYPNDVFAITDTGKKKISGILIEHGFSGSDCIYSIIGIGVNVNETNFTGLIENEATSLKKIGFNFEIEEVEKLLINKFSLLLEQNETDIFNLWKSELNIIGKNIHLISANKNEYTENENWIAIELLKDGRLKIENEKKKILIIDNGDSVRYDIN
ncbi:MAG: biotin--[acetyl-CoA-carboxylase] ligase [Ignavibacteria bacterium GWF2_33_9]|nr:MAG: biotin--[acetyl-CoA-carboxylase] ligase [Ignavibacteria bacterium GWF2_33_9]